MTRQTPRVRKYTNYVSQLNMCSFVDGSFRDSADIIEPPTTEVELNPTPLEFSWILFSIFMLEALQPCSCDFLSYQWSVSKSM